MRNLQEKLKPLRLARGMTQKDVAYQAWISQPHYAQIESGKLNPPSYLIEKLIRIMGGEIQVLVETDIQAPHFRLACLPQEEYIRIQEENSPDLTPERFRKERLAYWAERHKRICCMAEFMGLTVDKDNLKLYKLIK